MKAPVIHIQTRSCNQFACCFGLLVGIHWVMLDYCVIELQGFHTKLFFFFLNLALWLKYVLFYMANFVVQYGVPIGHGPKCVNSYVFQGPSMNSSRLPLSPDRFSGSMSGAQSAWLPLNLLIHLTVVIIWELQENYTSEVSPK